MRLELNCYSGASTKYLDKDEEGEKGERKGRGEALLHEIWLMKKTGRPCYPMYHLHTYMHRPRPKTLKN
jgi:hypothetical protein